MTPQRRYGVMAVLVSVFVSMIAAPGAHAAWMWDANQDKIDDRMARVEVQGLAAAHVGGILTARRRFAVMNDAADGLPSGATLDPTSGLFAWTPTGAQVGIFPVTFRATDPGTLADSEAIHLVVSAPGASSPPPLPCETESAVQHGIVDAGVDPVSVAYSYQTFTVAAQTQWVIGTLSWFGGPSRDLDFTLLDSDSNVVGGSASLSNPEVITVANLLPGTYIRRVTAFTNPDTAHYAITTQACVAAGPVAVAAGPGSLEFALAAAPNPSRGLSSLMFALPAPGPVSLKLYDVAGRLVRTLQDGPLPAGRHVRVWNRRSDGGTVALPGVYFARLDSGGRTLNRKLVMFR